MNKKDKLLEFFYDFHKLLEKENLWYVAEGGTLLGAIREGKMIEWDDDIDLGVSFETYNYLKNKYPNNILDEDTEGYPFIFPKWVPNKNEFLENDLFIDLFIIAPSTNKKMKKFRRPWNSFRFFNQMLNKKSKYKCYNFQLKLLKIVLWPFQWMTKKISIKEIENTILEKDNPEFCQFILTPNTTIKRGWRPIDIFERKKIPFDKYEIYVPLKSHEILKSFYGDNYMTPISSDSFIHVDAINIKKAN